MVVHIVLSVDGLQAGRNWTKVTDQFSSHSMCNLSSLLESTGTFESILFRLKPFFILSRLIDERIARNVIFFYLNCNNITLHHKILHLFSIILRTPILLVQLHIPQIPIVSSENRHFIFCLRYNYHLTIPVYTFTLSIV